MGINNNKAAKERDEILLEHLGQRSSTVKQLVRIGYFINEDRARKRLRKLQRRGKVYMQGLVKIGAHEEKLWGSGVCPYPQHAAEIMEMELKLDVDNCVPVSTSSPTAAIGSFT